MPVKSLFQLGVFNITSKVRSWFHLTRPIWTHMGHHYPHQSVFNGRKTKKKSFMTNFQGFKPVS